MRELTRQCGVEDCSKGGTHKEPYLATICRLYNQTHRIVYMPDGSVRSVPRTGSVAKALGGQEPAREAAVAVVAENPKAGTVKELKAAAKALKIRCFNWMGRKDLEEAVECSKAGNAARLGELEEAGRQKSKASWEAWQTRKG